MISREADNSVFHTCVFDIGLWMQNRHWNVMLQYCNGQFKIFKAGDARNSITRKSIGQNKNSTLGNRKQTLLVVFKYCL